MIVKSQCKLDHKVDPIPASTAAVVLHKSHFELFVFVTSLDKSLQMLQTLQTHSGLIIIIIIIFCQLLFIILIIRVK